MECVARGDPSSGLRADGDGGTEREGEGERGGGMEVRRNGWQW